MGSYYYVRILISSLFNLGLLNTTKFSILNTLFINTIGLFFLNGFLPLRIFFILFKLYIIA